MDIKKKVREMVEQHRSLGEFYALVFAYLSSARTNKKIYVRPEIWNDVASELTAANIEFRGQKDGDDSWIQILI